MCIRDSHCAVHLLHGALPAVDRDQAGQEVHAGGQALLDQMAAEGLRLNRFFSGHPSCSPTRVSVITGRHPNRCGTFAPNFSIRPEEISVATIFRQAGYATGHFGKWHLNGLRGPGVPILGDDTHCPGPIGFDVWLSVTNFFDLNPVMSRQGKFEEFKGDSSEIIVDEALKFITKKAKAKEPFFTVIWYGTPHSPWMAEKADQKPFTALTEKAREHYGELVAMDRSIGTLRKGLRDLEIEKDTLVWFTSDNGGLPGFKPSTTGGLRDFKGSMYEGGLRVPAIIEWPAGSVSEDPPDGVVRRMVEQLLMHQRRNHIVRWADHGSWIQRFLSHPDGPYCFHSRQDSLLQLFVTDIQSLQRIGSGENGITLPPSIHFIGP